MPSIYQANDMNEPSIKRSLLIRCGIAIGVILCLLSSGVYLLARQSLYRELDESIEQTAALLANQLELEDDRINFEWQEGMGTNKALILDGLFQYWNETTGTSTRSPALYFRDLPRFTGIDGRPLLRNITLPNGHRARAVGMRIYPFVLGEEWERMHQRGNIIDPKTLPHVLVVARDSEPVHHTLERLRWLLWGCILLTLAIGFATIHRVIQVTLRPIDDLARQVKDRSEQQLDSALDLPGALPAELSGLAKNFDSLLSRVAALRQRERDFIRHAAHELRTPIAGLRATTDLALSQNRDAAAYASHLATCQKTAAELGELVKRLSALSRIGQQASPPPRVALDLTTVIAPCIETFLPLFEESGITVKKHFPPGPVMVSSDETSLRIILSNLFDNAACYASPDSELRVRIAKEDGRIVIGISNLTDDPPEDPERLFEPLFRRESSRTDAASHLGIGLTLSLETAASIGATLKAAVSPDKWIEFTLALPEDGH